MASQSATTRGQESLISLPSNTLAYVAVLAALVTAIIHLFLAPRVMGFSQTMGILFYLNGLGFLGGVLLYLSRYWRRELYLVAAAYALVTIVAFFVMSGRLTEFSIAAKVAEAVFVAVTAYLYVSTKPS
jgi:hypothetical protein